MRKRIAISVLSLSAAGFVGILLQEGYSDKAIIPVPGDVPTLGFGTTEGVKMGDRITPPKAAARALKDVTTYEGAIKRCVKVELSQAEYDAYTDLAYNIGPGAFCNSTLVKKLNNEDYPSACAAILDWKRYKQYDCSLAKNKHVCGGLWTRRQAAYKSCMGGE